MTSLDKAFHPDANSPRRPEQYPNISMATEMLEAARTTLEGQILYSTEHLSSITKNRIVTILEGLDLQSGMEAMYGNHPYYEGESSAERAVSWARQELKKKLIPIQRDVPAGDQEPLQRVIDRLDRAGSVTRPSLERDGDNDN